MPAGLRLTSDIIAKVFVSSLGKSGCRKVWEAARGQCKRAQVSTGTGNFLIPAPPMGKSDGMLTS